MQDGLRFALYESDDFANDEYAKIKDIAVKKITPAVRGSNDKNNLANPPVQVSDITVSHLVDFVKRHFKENKRFAEGEIIKLGSQQADAALANTSREYTCRIYRQRAR